MLGLCLPSLKCRNPLRITEFTTFHDLKIRTSFFLWSKLNTMLLGAKEKESLDLTSRLWHVPTGTCLTLISALALYPPVNSPLKVETNSLKLNKGIFRFDIRK